MNHYRIQELPLPSRANFYDGLTVLIYVGKNLCFSDPPLSVATSTLYIVQLAIKLFPLIILATGDCSSHLLLHTGIRWSLHSRFVSYCSDSEVSSETNRFSSHFLDKSLRRICYIEFVCVNVVIEGVVCMEWDTENCIFGKMLRWGEQIGGRMWPIPRVCRRRACQYGRRAVAWASQWAFVLLGEFSPVVAWTFFQFL